MADLMPTNIKRARKMCKPWNSHSLIYYLRLDRQRREAFRYPSAHAK